MTRVRITTPLYGGYSAYPRHQLAFTRRLCRFLGYHALILLIEPEDAR